MNWRTWMVLLALAAGPALVRPARAQATERGYFPALGLYRLPLPAGVHTLVLPLAMPASQSAFDVFGPELFDLEAVESWDAAAQRWRAYFPRRPFLAGSPELASSYLRITTLQSVVLTLRGSIDEKAGPQWFTPLGKKGPIGAVWPHDLSVRQVHRHLADGAGFVAGRDPLWFWSPADGAWIPTTNVTPGAALPPATALSGAPVTPPSAAPSTPPTTATTSATAATGTTGPAAAATAPPPPPQRKVVLPGGEETGATKGEERAESVPNFPDAPPASTAFAGLSDASGNTVEGLADYTAPKSVPFTPPSSSFAFKGYYTKPAADPAEPPEALIRLTLPQALTALTSNLSATVAARVHFLPGGKRVQAYEVLGVAQIKIPDAGAKTVIVGAPAGKSLLFYVGSDGRVYAKGMTSVSAVPGASGGFRSPPTATPVTVANAPVTVYFNGALNEKLGTGPALQLQVSATPTAFAFRRWGITGQSPLPAPRSDPTSPVADVGQGIAVTRGWWLELPSQAVPTLSLTAQPGWRANTLPATLRTDAAGASVTAVEAQGITACSINSLVQAVSVPFGGIGSAASPLPITFWPSGRVDVYDTDVSSIQGTAQSAAYVTSHAGGTGVALALTPVIQIQGKALPALTPLVSMTASLTLANQSGADTGIFFFTAAAQSAVQVTALGTLLNGQLSNVKGDVNKLVASIEQLVHPAQGQPSSFLDTLQTLGLQSASFKGGVAGVFDVPGGRTVAIYATGERGICRRADPKSPLIPYTKGQGGLSYGTPSADPGSGFAVSLSGQRKLSQDGKTMDDAYTLELDASYQFPSAATATSRTDVDGQLTGFLKRSTPVAGGSDVNTRTLTFNIEEERTRVALSASDAGLQDILADETPAPFSLDDFSASFSAVDDGSGKVKKSASVLAQLSAHWSAGTTPPAGTGEGEKGEGKKKEGGDEGCGVSIFVDASWGRTVTGNVTPSAAPSANATPSSVRERLAWIFQPDPFSLPDPEDFELGLEAEFTNVPSSTPAFKLKTLAGTLAATESGHHAVRTGSLSTGMQFKPPGAAEPFALTLNLEKGVEGWSGGAFLADLAISKTWTLTEAFIAWVEQEHGAWWHGLSFGGNFKLSEKDTRWFNPATIGMEVNLAEKLGLVTGSVGGTCATSAPYCLKSGSITGTLSLDEGRTLDLTMAATAALPDIDNASLSVDANLSLDTDPHLQSLGLQLAAPRIDLWDGWTATGVSLSGTRDNVTDSWSGSGTLTVNPPPGLANLGGVLQLKPFSASVSRNPGQVLVVGDLTGTSFTIPGVDWAINFNRISFAHSSPWRLAGMTASFSAGTGTTYAVDVTPDAGALSFVFAANPTETVTVPLGDVTFAMTAFVLTVAEVNGALTVTLSGHASVTEAGSSTPAYTGDISLSIGRDGSITGMLTNIENGSGGAAGVGGGGVGRATIGSITISSQVDPTTHRRTTSLSGALSFTFGDDWPGLAGKTVTGHVSGSTSGDFSMAVTSAVQIDLPLLPVDLAVTTFGVTRTSGNFAIGGAATVTIESPLHFLLGNSRAGEKPSAQFHCSLSCAQTDVSGAKKWLITMAADTSGFASPPIDLGPLGTWALALNHLDVSSRPAVDLALRLTDTTHQPPWYLDIAGSYAPPAQVTLNVSPSTPLKIGSSTDLFELALDNLNIGESIPDMLGIGASACMRIGNSPAFKLLLDAQSVFYVLPSSFPPYGMPFVGDAATQTGLTLEIALLGFGGNITLAFPKPAFPSGFDVGGLVVAIMHGFQKDSPDLSPRWKDDWADVAAFLRTQTTSILEIFKGPGLGNINLALPQQLHDVFPSLQLGYLVSPGSQCEADSGSGDQVVLFPVWSGMHYLTDVIQAAFSDATADAGDVFIHLLHYIAILKQVFTNPTALLELVPQQYRSGTIDFSFAGSASISGGYTITNDKALVNTGTCPQLPTFLSFVTFSRGADDPTTCGLPLITDVAGLKAPLQHGQAFSFPADGQTYSGTADDRWVDPHDEAVKSFALMASFVATGNEFVSDAVLKKHVDRMTQENGGLTVSTGDHPLLSTDGNASLKLIGSTSRLDVKSNAGQTLYTGSVPLMGLTTITVPGMTGQLELNSFLTVSGAQFTSHVTARIVYGLTALQQQQLAQHTAYVQAWATYNAALAAYNAWQNQYNAQYSSAYNTWANTPANVNWGSVEHAMNRKHSLYCDFHHFSPGDNWRQNCQYLSQVADFIYFLRNNCSGDCNCCGYAADEIASEVGANVNFTPPAPTSSCPPDPGAPPAIIDPGIPQPRAPTPLTWRYDQPLFRETSSSELQTGPEVTGWIATYDMRPAEHGTILLTFTDWGTVKFSAPGAGFTAIYPGALLTDFHQVVHTVLHFKDEIFSYDSSPYLLGLTFWNELFPGTPSGGAAGTGFNAKSVTVEGRTVTVGLTDSQVSLSMILEDIGYAMTVPKDAPSGTKAKVRSLDAATDLQTFAIQDGNRLVATPFTVGVTGGGGATDAATVNDLVIFEGGPDVRAALAKRQQQKKRLRTTDLSKLLGQNVDIHGKPLVVRDLALGITSGQVSAMVRSRRVDFDDRTNGNSLATVQAGQQGLLEELEANGPYGDKALYPTQPGQFVASSFDNTRSGWASTVTSSQLDTLKSMGVEHICRTFALKAPAALSGNTIQQHAPGQFTGTVGPPGTQFDLTIPSGYLLVDPHGSQTVQPVITPPNGLQTLVDSEDRPISPQPPAPAQVSLNLAADGKTVSGSVNFNGQARGVRFSNAAGTPVGNRLSQCDGTFTYPTGDVMRGGLTASLTLVLNIVSVLDFSAKLEGEILSDGYFHFEGDVDLSLVGLQVANGRFILDAHTGLTILGKLDLIIADAYFDGNISKGTGVQATGHLAAGLPAPVEDTENRDFTVDTSTFTGIDAQMNIDSQSSPYLVLDGNAYIYGDDIVTTQFEISSSAVTFTLDESCDPVSVDLAFTLNWTGGLAVCVDCDVGLDLWLGTVHAHIQASIDISSSPSFCISIGPGYAQIGFNPFSLSGGLGDCPNAPPGCQ